MALEYYYFPTSHWSRVMSLVIAEKGLDPERRFVDITKNGTFDPEYMKKNPRGVVPTLVHDGETIWDSKNICDRLDMISGPPVRRRDDAECARWEDVLEDFPLMLFSYSVWILGRRGERSGEILLDKIDRAKRYAGLYPDLAEHYLRKQSFFERFHAEVTDEKYVADEEKTRRAVLDELGARVTEHPFASGDTWGFADAIATSILYRLLDLRKLDDWRGDEHPLGQYYARLVARPSFRAVFIDDPLLRPPS